MSTPHELAEERVKIAGEYARNAELLSKILEVKPKIWSEIRKTTNSDKAADREWEGMDEGIKEMKLRLALKSQEKKMSAIRTMLEVASGEARNQW